MNLDIMRRMIRVLCSKPPPKYHSYCKADPTACFYETASINTTGHPPDHIVVGAHTHIRGELTLFGHGGRIVLGEYCYIGEQSRLWSGTEILVGDRVLIAHHVTIMDNLTHPLLAKERAQHFRAIITTGHPKDIDLGDKPVVLGNDSWIGCHSVILRGVTVGARSIVAAGSIVTEDVPSDVVVAGNPAKIIKKISQ